MHGPARIAAVLLLAVGVALTVVGMGIGLVGVLGPELVWRRLPAGVVSVDAIGGALVAGGSAGVAIGLAHCLAGYRSWSGRADGISALAAVAAAVIGLALVGSAVAALVEVTRSGTAEWALLALGLAIPGSADLVAAGLLAVGRAQSHHDGGPGIGI